MEFRTLLIGGIIPAILLGSGTVLMKLSLRSGISFPLYLVIVGSSVLSYGTIAHFLAIEKKLTPAGGLFAFVMGLSWSTAILCMSYAISTLKIPVSVIAPLTNSNSLIAVPLSAIVFSELKDLNYSKVLFGTILIIAGATIVSTAPNQAIAKERTSMKIETARSALKHIDINAPFEKVYTFISEPLNWPQYAIVNMRSVKTGKDGWYETVTKFGEGQLKMHSVKEFGIFDHTWKDPQASWTVPARVVKNGTGVTVMMTIFKPSVMTDAQFDGAMKEMDIELNKLKEILEK